MPTLDAKPHVGSVGLELVVFAPDQDGDPLDLSGATQLLVYLTRPDGTVLTKTAVLDTDGTDGLFKYVTQSGDLSVKGTWKIQGYVAGVAGFSGPTREAPFEVFASRHG
jgi:hypothetical protein